MFRRVNPNGYNFPRQLNQLGSTAHYGNPMWADEQLSEFESDEFRMYSFKVKRCPMNWSHDWTVCPYAHKGEKARRRDPRRMNYAAVACPDFRMGQCPRAELCEFSHGVFEYWLHPARYRTRACTAGPHCNRKVCFFAHSPQELRPDTRYRSIFSYRVQPYAPAVGGAPNGGGGVSWALAGIDDGVGGRSGGGNGGANGENEDEKPKELKLEFLESLRKLTTKEDSHDHRQGEKWGRVEWELPNAEWVSDLLAGR